MKNCWWKKGILRKTEFIFITRTKYQKEDFTFLKWKLKHGCVRLVMSFLSSDMSYLIQQKYLFLNVFSYLNITNSLSRNYYCLCYMVFNVFLIINSLQGIVIDQRCPTVFFRSPQLWRIKPAIRHIIFFSSFITHFTQFITIKLTKFIKITFQSQFCLH